MYANAARAAGEIIMTDPAVYLEKIAAFSRMLRLEGLIVSPMETADACHVLITLGFEDRELVKTALRTVYAKSRRHNSPLIGSLTVFSSQRKPCVNRPRRRCSGKPKWRRPAGKPSEICR